MRIPISAAKKVAEEQNCRQVILLAWDGELTHIVTYGKTADDCAQAATGGNLLKEKWGWPECNDQPSRVKKLQSELSTLRGAAEEMESSLKLAISNLDGHTGQDPKHCESCAVIVAAESALARYQATKKG